MRKYLAVIAAVMVVMISSLSMTVFAVESPVATPNPPQSQVTDQSPKTGDRNILFVELAGAALAVTAVVARKHSVQEAQA